jgi:Flp pilus assembly protein CpaB
MTSVPSRRSLTRRFTPGLILNIVLAIAAAAGIGVGGWTMGLYPRSSAPVRDTTGLVAVPIPMARIPIYTKITRDHLWDPKNQRFAAIYLPPEAVMKEMIVNRSEILGRVLNHEKQPGYVFTEADFFVKGMREGIVAGIPPGKRAIRVEATKVEGLYGLQPGDRFDLVASLAIDASGRGGGGQAFNIGGAYGQQLALQARLSNWQKQATVRVLVQNGMLVEPLTTRQVPFFSNTLTQGGITRMRPVQEIVIAVDPDEVAKLTEAMAVDAKISTVPRSGHPDDPKNSVTPELQPVNPFTGPGFGVTNTTTQVDGSSAQAPFSMVETITGGKRELTAVPTKR